MRHFILCIILCLPNLAAEDYTVEPGKFSVVTPLEATFLPSDSVAVKINPEEWTDFTITSLVEHGSNVSKGSSLIDIDSRALDKKISALEQSVQLGELELAQKKQDLQQLEITTPRSLEAFARGERETAEDLQHYISTHQALEVERAQRSITRAEFSLASQEEELGQLLKMYDEDGKTEETEEIILKRARYYVEYAKFSLESARKEADWELKTEIPRRLEAKKRAAENARIANAEAQQKLPRELNIKQQETAKAIKDHEEEKDKLAKLRADRAMMDIKAPTDGIVYYGEIKEGKWIPDAAAKLLQVGSKLRAHTTLMTIIPKSTQVELYALASEDQLSSISSGATGYATAKKSPLKSFPVKVSSVASYPSTKGTYLTRLAVELPADTVVAPGTKANVKIITHSMDQALLVPLDYVKTEDNGDHTVQVKLADGNTSTRSVTVGVANEKSAVITGGIEQGQVLVK
ncbi:MAG: HlyD family efflux transporter periplasmic adaptor subunit [Akkermansiaceae bacterium]